MANTTVAITQLALGTQADVAGTAIVDANTHVITPTKGMRKILIRLVNTTAAQKTMTVAAGDNPPAASAGQGSLVTTLADGSTTPTVAWVLLEAARYIQSNGTIEITVAASTTGFITAFQLP